MTLNMYNNKSEPNVLNKVLEQGLQVSCTLKDNCSIIEPVFIIAYDVDTMIGKNYAVCDELLRSYFINDVIILANGVAELHCKCDVLRTYRDSIVDREAIIGRQAYIWNLYLDDNQFKVYQGRDYDFIEPDAQHKAVMATDKYILMVAGGGV